MGASRAEKHAASVSDLIIASATVLSAVVGIAVYVVSTNSKTVELENRVATLQTFAFDIREKQIIGLQRISSIESKIDFIIDQGGFKNSKK